jgi:putative spermidine/putrescine transport system substrate-binding protein
LQRPDAIGHELVGAIAWGAHGLWSSDASDHLPTVGSFARLGRLRVNAMLNTKRCGLYGILAIVLGLFANVSPAPAESLVIYGWVGPNEAGFRKEFFPAFEKKYGATIEYLSASSFLNYGRLKAERSNPQADVALFDDIILEQARKDGLLEPLDTTVVQHLDDIAPDARFKDNMGVGVGYNVVSLYYNTKVFQERGFAPLVSWNDLLRPELKGRIVIRNVTSSYGLFVLLMLARSNGGSDADIEPGFAKMKELSPSVISFPTGHGPLAQMTLEGDAWVGATGLGEMQDLLDKKAPLKFFIPKEAQSRWLRLQASSRVRRTASLHNNSSMS